jgi:hypothetical protein
MEIRIADTFTGSLQTAKPGIFPIPFDNLSILNHLNTIAIIRFAKVSIL